MGGSARSFGVLRPSQVGDKFPSVALDEGAPDKKVKTSELLAGKKVVVFGVPGAFTPGCRLGACTTAGRRHSS
jgi:peroxiredoxin